MEEKVVVARAVAERGEVREALTVVVVMAAAAMVAEGKVAVMGVDVEAVVWVADGLVAGAARVVEGMARDLVARVEEATAVTRAGRMVEVASKTTRAAARAVLAATQQNRR